MQDTDSGDRKMQKDTSIEKEWVMGAVAASVYLAHALRYLSVYVCHTLYHKIYLQPVHLLIDEPGEREK